MFQGTENAIEIAFSEDRTRTWFVRIVGRNWKTASGLRIGATLAELERINGGPFELSGFDWDHGGAIFPGPGGKLPKGIGIKMAPTKTVSQRESQQVAGDRKISSRHPVVRKMGVTVRELVVTYPR